MKVVAICGSLRAASLNRKLLRALAAASPDGMDVELAELHGIPVYDGDLEQRAFPEAVTALQDRLAAADAILLGSPEYNGGVPGPLKNAIDWCSRGGRMKEVYAGKPLALVGATPGGSGTRHAQQAWQQTFRVLGVDFWNAGVLYLARASGSFDDAGAVSDPKLQERLARFMEGFRAFAALRSPSA